MHTSTTSRLTALALLAFFSHGAWATSQCPAGANCPALDEGVKVSIAASLVALQQSCDRIEPNRKKQHAEAIARMTATDPAGFAAALKSPLFAATLSNANKEIATKAPDQLKQACDGLVQQ